MVFVQHLGFFLYIEGLRGILPFQNVTFLSFSAPEIYILNCPRPQASTGTSAR